MAEVLQGADTMQGSCDGDSALEGLRGLACGLTPHPVHLCQVDQSLHHLSHTRTHARRQAYVRTNTQRHTQSHSRIHTQRHAHARTHTRTHTRANTRVHTRAHTDTHAHIHTNAHKQVYSRSSVLLRLKLMHQLVLSSNTAMPVAHGRGGGGQTGAPVDCRNIAIL